MTVDDKPLTSEFERLQSQGQSAFEQGRIEEAIALLTSALEWAEERADQRRCDLAFCNLCSATVGLDSLEPLPAEAMNRLREILLRNEDLTNCRLAAYVLARVYELKKESRKGLFYARIGLERSQLLKRRDWMASSHNQIGNLLMAQSHFEQAAAEYGQALELQPAGAEERRLLILVNLAYSLLAREYLQRGFELLHLCLRYSRRLGFIRAEMFTRIDLCYAHLEAGRYRDAIRHGKRGLQLAEELGEADSVKNALYLLGQAAHLTGDADTARRTFCRLQDEFYPGSTGIASFLMAIDVRKMINLRA